ncbi:MAG: hypothetical protein N6V49_03890, partial [Serratia symbiotica]|nr:hypothetical protein [Serratia symbiotica]
LPSSALRGALCVYGRFASTNFFPIKWSERPFVRVVNIVVKKAPYQTIDVSKHQLKGEPAGSPG